MLRLAPGAAAQSSAPGPGVTLYGVVTGDPSGVEGIAAAEQATPVAVDPADRQKRGEFVVAPLPMVNPTLENGLALVVGYLYRIDRNDAVTAPSASGVAGFKTSNDSWGAAVLQSLHLWHDRFRLLGVAAYGDVNYKFYGIGGSAGANGASIDLNQVGPAAAIEGLIRIAPNWYVGARYQMMRMTVTTDSLASADRPTLPAQDANLRTAALGPRLHYDSRDNPFYPRRGMQVQGIASFYTEAVGGNRTYQVYQGWINRYTGVGARHVFAWHAGACGVDGSVPFYDLCMLGKSQDLRGYTVGQYRDRAMVAAQAEWRSELWWRFGATVFGGGGEVVPDFERLNWNDALPSGGVGLRFTVAKRNHVNLRADYAWGKGSSALYVSVAEAF
jgi:hypothetical protein